MTKNVLVIGGEPAERIIFCSAITEKLSYNTSELSYEADDNNLLPLQNISYYDVILFDISKLANPAERIGRIRALAPAIPIIVLARYGDYESAMAAVTAGAADFMTKPVAIERMSVTFRNVLMLNALQKGNKGSHPGFSLFNEDGNIRRIYELEKEVILQAVQYYDGRMSEVARRLGIGRSTLYRKLNGSGISVARDNRYETRVAS